MEREVTMRVGCRYYFLQPDKPNCRLVHYVQEKGATGFDGSS